MLRAALKGVPVYRQLIAMLDSALHPELTEEIFRWVIEAPDYTKESPMKIKLVEKSDSSYLEILKGDISLETPICTCGKIGTRILWKWKLGEEGRWCVDYMLGINYTKGCFDPGVFTHRQKAYDGIRREFWRN